MHRQSEKKLVKQQYLLRMSSQYGELRPTNGWDRFVSLRDEQISTNFTSWLHYCTDVAQRRSTKLCRMFGRLLGWYTIYIFGGSCTLMEVCQLQNSLCVQVMRSPILAALLHSTRAASVSQTLRHGTRYGIKELLQRAPPVFCWAAIALGIGRPTFWFLFVSKYFASVGSVGLAEWLCIRCMCVCMCVCAYMCVCLVARY